MIDVDKIKKDFLIFNSNDKIHYLDSAATSQRPKQVISAVESFYEKSNANPHRGAYSLSIDATKKYNDARHKIAQFINAQFDEEIIFTKNATEALNLFAYSFGLENLSSDNDVVISIMEHHSNLVPWQRVTKIKNSTLKYIYLNDNYELDDNEIDTKITEKTKIVSVTHISNAVGTINNIEKIIAKAHSVGAVALIDVSQSIAHHKIDVQKLNADFIVFSGHKMFAPFGIGVLYGKKVLLEKMSPFLMGGDMIEYVHEQETTFAPLPNKFEAGTQNVAGAVGLAAAIDYVLKIGYENIESHEKYLTNYLIEELNKLSYVDLYCTDNMSNLGSVVSFNVKGLHPHDISTFLDAKNICIRAGNHCAQPLMRYLNIDSTCRVSLSIYNNKEDIDALIVAIKSIYEKFKKYIEK